MDFNIKFPKKKAADGSDDNRPWYVKYLGLLVAGVAVLVVLISGIAWRISAHNDGNRLQNQLNAQYNVNIAKLGDCIIKIRESSGIAKGETAAFDKIIEDAVKGRYEVGSTAQPTGGALFSAIKEAYPDLTNLGSTFNKVLEVTVGCRSDYQSYQEKLQSQIKTFNDWRNGSLSGNLWAGGYPTSELHAVKGDQTLKGQEALDQMERVVTVSDAQKGYDSGTIVAEDPFGTATTVKSGG